MDETNKPADSPSTNDTATHNTTRSVEGGKASGASRRVDRATADLAREVQTDAPKVSESKAQVAKRGETADKFPAEGGSYRKGADGSLRRAEQPTKPAGTVEVTVKTK